MASNSLATAVRSTRLQVVLLVIAAIAVTTAITMFYLSTNRVAQQQIWTDQLREAQSAAADLTQAGADISAGVQPDFDIISSDIAEFDDILKSLHQGNIRRGISPLPSAVRKQFEALNQSWARMKSDAAEITEEKNAYRETVGATYSIASSIPPILQSYDKVSRQVAAHGGSQLTYQVTTQLALLQHIRSAALGVTAEGSVPEQRAQQLSDLIDSFVRVNQRLITADNAETAALAQQLASDFAPNVDAAAKVVKNAPRLQKILAGSKSLNDWGANTLLPSIHDLVSTTQAISSNNRLYQIVAYIAGIVALLALIAFVASFIAAQVARRRVFEIRDRQQQQAILGLLDEITNLASGDLTVDVTVTEDFTGAIADSINYTVQTLRGLVGTINQTSEQIASSTTQTSGMARRMSEDSDRQARKINEMAESISASSQQLQEVSGRAERLSAQAQTSVQIAHNGAETVARTITNMTTLREQIQDTAKRIKRLGESSQEIGNIIEFIDDIAEQTSTLALNASIQAAMAGEAGRGFAVVAEQVQALAERAGSATRQVENLVKAIQADSQAAITSMERSTSNVVAGAQSAEEAGQSLTRIETSSQDLARLIGEISVATNAQSATATRIAGDMQSVRQIAVQTSGSADETAHAVDRLNALSDQLRESVSGFTLPAEP